MKKKEFVVVDVGLSLLSSLFVVDFGRPKSSSNIHDDEAHGDNDCCSDDDDGSDDDNGDDEERATAKGNDFVVTSIIKNNTTKSNIIAFVVTVETILDFTTAFGNCE